MTTLTREQVEALQWRNDGVFPTGEFIALRATALAALSVVEAARAYMSDEGDAMDTVRDHDKLNAALDAYDEARDG